MSGEAWLKGAAVMQHGILNMVCEAWVYEPLLNYIMVDEAGTVLDVLSLMCASAQDLAFLCGSI